MYDHVKPGTNTFVKVYCDTDSMAIAKDSFFCKNVVLHWSKQNN